MFHKNTYSNKRNLTLRLILLTFTAVMCFCSNFTAAATTTSPESIHFQQLKELHYRALKQTFKTIGSTTSTGQSTTLPTKMRIILDTWPNTNGNFATLNNLTTSLQNQGIHITRRLDRFNLLALNVTEAQLDQLFANTNIRLLSEDAILEPSLAVSVPYIGAQALQQSDIKGAGQAVAIFDTGVDAAHTFLSARVVEEACFSSGDQSYSFSLCPNGQNKQLGKGAAQSCSPTNIGSDCMHGTHVAGIAAGSGTDMTGVAPAAKIIAVQVFTRFSNSSRLGAYSSDLIAAFDWLIYEAVTPNIAAINMSLGGGSYSSYCDDSTPALTQAINLLRSRGTATVIASGNNGYGDSVSWPGCISSAVTVGASGRNEDSLAWFSNTATMVDIVAPGLNIYSSVPNNNFTSMSGTSMAAPHITGAFALLKSASPTTGLDALEQAMISSGKIIHTSSGIDLPRVDLTAAVQKIKPALEVIEAESYSAMSGVQTETTLDIGGGLNLGWIDSGDWMSYKLDLPVAGKYQVYYRVASPNYSGVIQLENDSGYPIYGFSSVPYTGGWQSWTTTSQSVSLPAGKQTLKLRASSGGFNLNWFKVELIAKTPSILLQAEDYSYMSGIQTEPTSDTGGGLNVGWIDTGDWLSYVNTPINIPMSGSYDLEFRVASPNQYGELSFEQAGANRVYARLAIPNTGGWQNWTTIKTRITLEAGTHTFGINAKNGGWNINWLRITSAN